MKTSGRKVWILVGCMLLLAVGGVYWFLVQGEKPTGEITGKVSLQGTLLSSGQVSFLPRQGLPRQGTIQKDGTYHVKDVACEEAIIVVSQFPEEVQRLAKMSEKERKKFQESWAGKSWNFLPAQYGSPHSSPLRFQVQPGKNRFDIELKE
jgi:hypothetical protein